MHKVVNKNKRNMITTESFINDSVLIHGNKYDYSLVNYINSKTNVKIICPIHGKMEISTAAHRKNTGCELCDRYEKFVKKANTKHGEKFDYSAVVYYNSTTQIKIICPKHGETLQYPPDHLRGPGCSECGKEIRIDKLKNNENSFRKSGFKSMAKGRKCVFYVIKCFNENELFYKIGITTHSIRRRFYGKKFPYEYEILIENEGDAETIWDIENNLKMSLKSNYKPLIEFGGCKRECFSSLNEILNLLNK